jgi:hypothetical protein
MPGPNLFDDPEAVEFLEELRDRPLPVGSVAALAAAAQRGDLDDAIKESKTTPGIDGAVAQAQVELAEQEAEREHADAIKKPKSSFANQRPRSNFAVDPEDIAKLHSGASPRSSAQEFRHGPASAPIPPTLLPSAQAAARMAETTRRVEESLRTYYPEVTVNAPAKPKRTDLPLWAKWALPIAGLLVAGAGIVLRVVFG